MKEDILQQIGVYEKGPVGHIIALFHKYSVILDNVFDRPIEDNQNLFYVDEQGGVFHCGFELVGIQKIVALIAIGKQKKTPGNTFNHEKLLNIHQVVRKDRESVAIYNEKFRSHGYPVVSISHSGWNHLLPLTYALHSVMKMEDDGTEMRIILAGLIMMYLHLQGLPIWLVIEGEIGSDWDDLILEMVDDFIPEKFVARAYACGFGKLLEEIEGNLIFSTTNAIIDSVSQAAEHSIHLQQDYSNGLIRQIQTKSLNTGANPTNPQI